MAEDRKKVRAETLKLAVQALVAKGEPTHYKDVCALMMGIGWSTDGDAEYRVYASLYGAARDKEDGVIFLGKGQFALVSMPGMESMTSAPPKVTKRTKVRQEPAQVPMVCGNCRSIRFSGVHLISQESGTCQNDEESQRPYVRSDDLACPFFKVRSISQKRSDDAEQQRLMPIVNAVNRLAHQHKCWDSVTKIR